MNDKLSYYKSAGDSSQPQQNFEETPSMIGRVLCGHKWEDITNNRYITLSRAMSHRVLGINEKITERHQVRH